jgi:hypothetical protein
VQQVEGRYSEAEGGEDHSGRMIQSHDELIMEMAQEYGLNRMGENDDEEDEDADDEGNTVTPTAPTPTTVPEEIIEEEALVEIGP